MNTPLQRLIRLCILWAVQDGHSQVRFRADADAKCIRIEGVTLPDGDELVPMPWCLGMAMVREFVACGPMWRKFWVLVTGRLPSSGHFQMKEAGGTVKVTYRVAWRGSDLDWAALELRGSPSLEAVAQLWRESATEVFPMFDGPLKEFPLKEEQV